LVDGGVNAHTAAIVTTAMSPSFQLRLFFMMMS
jgi:hypothetical protein